MSAHDEATSRRWFQPMLERLRALPQHPRPEARTFFDPDAPVVVARAPGRLDVMGGIADYSGSLVLELPLACATFAAVQRQPEARCDVLTLRRNGADASHFSIAMDALQAGPLRSADALRKRLTNPADHWAAYIVGLVHYGLHRLDSPFDPTGGFRMVIWSEVPSGKGVSSSAALEVAAMTALTGLYDTPMLPEQLASACQWAENHIAGAPCGIMDQMTCTLGKRDHLLRLRCQPALVEGHVRVPDGYAFCGIDSGIRHVVSGADYGTVRTAAFMGHRILSDAARQQHRLGSGWETGEEQELDYLANLTPSEYGEQFRDLLPDRMSGHDFLDRYGETSDPVTTVDPNRVYPVRAATGHPVYENARVERFAELLSRLAEDGQVAPEMGRLMYDAHQSYGACGLGSDGTDRLVEMVMRLGPAHGLFGAKITGGGSGGTVAVFSTKETVPHIHSLAERYATETGRSADVFTGSSPGSAETGYLVLKRLRNVESLT